MIFIETPRQSPPSWPRSHREVVSELKVGCHALVRARRGHGTQNHAPRRWRSARSVRKYETRLAITASDVPVPLNAPRNSRSEGVVNSKSPFCTPMKTPPAECDRQSGEIPADSRASQASSSTSLCRGSMCRASLGEMPKNRASNRSRSSRKPPEPPPIAGRRPGGGGATEHRPWISKSQNAVIEAAPG